MKPPTEKVVIIFDYSGISRSNADIQLIKEIAPILQNSFPERLFFLLITNIRHHYRHLIYIFYLESETFS